jgi:hypothetical protein
MLFVLFAFVVGYDARDDVSGGGTETKGHGKTETGIVGPDADERCSAEHERRDEHEEEQELENVNFHSWESSGMFWL